jgi:starch synthase
MFVKIITKEYPPEIYGGAGVHVSELVKAMRKLTEVEVYCFGKPRTEIGVQAFEVPSAYANANSAIQTLATDLSIANALDSTGSNAAGTAPTGIVSAATTSTGSVCTGSNSVISNSAASDPAGTNPTANASAGTVFKSTASTGMISAGTVFTDTTSTATASAGVVSAATTYTDSNFAASDSAGTTSTVTAPTASENKTAAVDNLDSAVILHSHTWYANYAGLLGSQLLGVPHILSAHSLEPLRPWKREQLGGGYGVSSYIEREAYRTAQGIIAVSNAMKADILRCYGDEVDPAKLEVIHNGVTVSDFESALTKIDDNRKIAKKLGVNPDLPTAVFVGRITRQKGLVHLLKAIELADLPVQYVLAASSPDTPEIAQEVQTQIESLQKKGRQIIWLSNILTRRELMAVLGVSDLFLCPSIYEPLGIVNLEAMACKLPVLASKVGGIPEVVEDTKTGYLVDYDPEDATVFERNFAKKLAIMFEDPSKLAQMGQAGYDRATSKFAWDSIAQQTINFYSKIISKA